MSSSKQSTPTTPGALETARVVELSATVEIADGAVVSRTLMRTDGGTVTAFAFDAGQALSEHTAPFDALVQVLAGELVVTIAGEEHPMTPGQAVVMPGGVPHAVRAPGAAKFLLVMLKVPKERE